MPSLADLEYAYYSSYYGVSSGKSVNDLKRDYYIEQLGSAYATASLDTMEHDFFNLINGTTGGAGGDEEFTYWSTLSGLTPARRYSVADHKFQVMANNGPISVPGTNLKAYYDARWPVAKIYYPNLLTANQASIETDASPWAAQNSGTFSRVTTEAFVGAASLQVIASGVSNFSGVTSSNFVSVVAGNTYTFSMMVKQGGAGALRVSLYSAGVVRSYKSAGGDAGVTLGASAWTQLTFSFTPTQTETLAISIDTGSVTRAVTFYIDAIGIWQGTSTVWRPPGNYNDGDTIPVWADLSGNGNHAMQSTLATTTPLLKKNIINGKPTIRFDGTDDYLRVATMTGFTLGKHTVYVVWKANSVVAADFAGVYSVEGSGASIYERLLIDTTTGLRVDHSSDAAAHTVGAETVPSVTANAIVHSVVVDGSTAKGYFNGTLGANISLASTWNIQYMDIGIRDRTNIAAAAAAIDIAALLVYDGAHSNATRQQIERSLGNIFGVTVA